MYIKTSNQSELKLGFGNYTCNWGMHMAGLYESEQERDDILCGFIERGIRDTDIELYCPVEQTKDEFLHTFCNYAPDLREEVTKDDHVSFLSAKDLYYPSGTFSPWAMDIGLNDFYKNSQKNGRRNVRATAEMVWALEAIPGIQHLFAYEARLNFFIPGKPWISICMYNVNKFPGDMIMNVLKTYPFTINGGIITQNPYYQAPEKWLVENAPEFLHSNN